MRYNSTFTENSNRNKVVAKLYYATTILACKFINYFLTSLILKLQKTNFIIESDLLPSGFYTP